MTTTKFKYRLDKRAKIITFSSLGAIALTTVLLWVFSLGGYLPAWFTSIATAILGLVVLSIPRSIRVTDEAVEIRCLVEITHITYNHLKSARRIDRAELRPLIPLFASPGFFGWFGYWLDVRGWDFIKVYTTSWRGLVIIEDIYEQRYLVNCDDPDRLVGAIESALALQAPRKPRTKKPAKTDAPKEQMSLF
jgi:hypothetical protein